MPPVSRAEWGWLAVAVIGGAILRLGNLQHVAVEHFDEAVYASNLLFPPELGGEFPRRQFYAPPLLPAVIEWSTIFGQLTIGNLPKWWPMLPTLFAGLATIPSVWWIARQWWSPRAGIMAALLIAFHEFHSAYSRTALTDVPLSLFVLWAVHWFWTALQTGGTRGAVIAGVFTSLAWWTKYSGWLPLAIAGAGGVCWLILIDGGTWKWFGTSRIWLRHSWPPFVVFLKLLLISGITGFVLWLPVLWDCQKIGGYGKVVENHRGYSSGLSRWIPHHVQGFENFDEFVGWMTLVGLIMAIACAYLPSRFLPDRNRKESTANAGLLAECLAGAWFWGLFVVTPTYYPYSRLWVPWLIAGSLVVAALLSDPRCWPIRTLADVYRACLRLTGVACGLVIVAAALAGRTPEPTSASFERRDSLFQAAVQIRQRVANPDAVLIVGESDPAIWYALRTLGSAAFLQSDFEFAEHRSNRPEYVVLGPLSQRLEGIQKNWDQYRDRFELVEEYPARLSRIALLDLFSPRHLADHHEDRTATVQLYRRR